MEGQEVLGGSRSFSEVQMDIERFGRFQEDLGGPAGSWSVRRIWLGLGGSGRFREAPEGSWRVGRISNGPEGSTRVQEGGSRR